MKLVIAEKPSVANDIAKVIGATSKQNGYLEGAGFIVTWCFGHLITQKMPEEYDPDLKKWELNNLPFIPSEYKYKVCEDTKKQFNLIKSLMEDNRVDGIVCATDAGREGELIFRLVYDMAGCKKPFERLWISSMTDSAIKKGFESLEDGNKYDPLYEAALTRANADFVLGINGTRLYSLVYNRLLKLGRVKSPTLTMVVNRENEINNFVKEPYFIVHLVSDVDGVKLNAKSDRFKTQQEAESLKDKLAGKTGEVLSVISEDKKLKSPRLYNLSTLQIDANKFFGFSAEDTLNILQDLYEKHKIVTYPRTDAEFLTEDMSGTVKNLLNCLLDRHYSDLKGVVGENIDILLNSKKVSDHHALLPTEYIKNFDFTRLNEKEEKIYKLIVSRLLMAVSDAQEYVATKIEIGFEDDIIFKQSGKVITKNGWKNVEAYFRKNVEDTEKNKDEDSPLPKLIEGQQISDNEFDISEHETKPPVRYTEGELIKAMDKAGVKDLDKDAERQGLGTSATRAGIIAELKKDGMLLTEKKNLYPSRDGILLVEVLPEELKSVDLTVEWENKLTQISKGIFSGSEFMSEIESFVRLMTENYKKPKDGVVFSGTGDTGKLNTMYLGDCPSCGGKVLKGKYGAYCSNKCGIMLNKAYGKALSDVQIKSILSGKKTLLKDLISKKGSTYDMYVTMDGVEKSSFNGKEFISIKYKTSFPDSK